MLAKAGARAIMQEYDDSGNVRSLGFSMPFNGRDVGFRLPANWEGVQILMREKRKRDSRHTPLEHLEAVHCINVTWRVIKDWVEAQLALIEANQVKTEQVFLPYALTNDGGTLYDKLTQDSSLLLGPGN